MGRTISPPVSCSTTPAFSARKPLVSAAVTEFEGQLSTYKAWLPGCPCYRCLFAAPPPAGSVPLLLRDRGAGRGRRGDGQPASLEVLKEAAGLGTGLAGRLLTYKALAGEFRTVRLPKDPACPLCGPEPAIPRPFATRLTRN